MLCVKDTDPCLWSVQNVFQRLRLSRPNLGQPGSVVPRQLGSARPVAACLSSGWPSFAFPGLAWAAPHVRSNLGCHSGVEMLPSNAFHTICLRTKKGTPLIVVGSGGGTLPTYKPQKPQYHFVKQKSSHPKTQYPGVVKERFYQGTSVQLGKDF